MRFPLFSSPKTFPTNITLPQIRPHSLTEVLVLVQIYHSLKVPLALEALQFGQSTFLARLFGFESGVVGSDCLFPHRGVWEHLVQGFLVCDNLVGRPLPLLKFLSQNLIEILILILKYCTKKLEYNYYFPHVIFNQLVIKVIYLFRKKTASQKESI